MAAVQTPVRELAERALLKMASGEWRLILEHPDPSKGTSLCGFEVGKEIARRALSAVGGEAVEARIADAVLSWMVKFDLLDAGNEYGPEDVLAVLNDLAPASPQPANPAQDEPDFSRSIAEVIKEEQVTDAMVDAVILEFAEASYALGRSHKYSQQPERDRAAEATKKLTDMSVKYRAGAGPASDLLPVKITDQDGAIRDAYVDRTAGKIVEADAIGAGAPANPAGQEALDQIEAACGRLELVWQNILVSSRPGNPTVGLMKEAIFTIRKYASAGAGGQAVAWGFYFDDGSGWKHMVCLQKPSHWNGHPVTNVVPLYTQPHPADERVVEALRDELRFYSSTEHGALDGIPFKHVARVIRVMLDRVSIALSAKEGR